MEDMRFVYSLVYNGQVFYIGITQDTVKRYKSHIKSIRSKNLTNTGKYIKCIIDAGNYPMMQIIDYLPLKAAIESEQSIIKAFSKAGHILTNSYLIRSTQWVRNIPNILTKKDVIKIIKYNQEIESIHLGYTHHSNYPKEPF